MRLSTCATLATIAVAFALLTATAIAQDTEDPDIEPVTESSVENSLANDPTLGDYEFCARQGGACSCDGAARFGFVDPEDYNSTDWVRKVWVGWVGFYISVSLSPGAALYSGGISYLPPSHRVAPYCIYDKKTTPRILFSFTATRGGSSFFFLEGGAFTSRTRSKGAGGGGERRKKELGDREREQNKTEGWMNTSSL